MGADDAVFLTTQGAMFRVMSSGALVELYEFGVPVSTATTSPDGGLIVLGKIAVGPSGDIFSTPAFAEEGDARRLQIRRSGQGGGAALWTHDYLDSADARYAELVANEHGVFVAGRREGQAVSSRSRGSETSWSTPRGTPRSVRSVSKSGACASTAPRCGRRIPTTWAAPRRPATSR